MAKYHREYKLHIFGVCFFPNAWHTATQDHNFNHKSNLTVTLIHFRETQKCLSAYESFLHD